MIKEVEETDEIVMIGEVEEETDETTKENRMKIILPKTLEPEEGGMAIHGLSKRKRKLKVHKLRS